MGSTGFCRLSSAPGGDLTRVHVPGGPLHIEWTAADRIIMTGPAEDEYEGEIVDG